MGKTAACQPATGQPACLLDCLQAPPALSPAAAHLALPCLQLVVGPDGAEQYGVKRKHVLRGTRFSLPKPKVGCHLLDVAALTEAVLGAPASGCLQFQASLLPWHTVWLPAATAADSAAAAAALRGC